MRAAAFSASSRLSKGPTRTRVRAPDVGVDHLGVGLQAELLDLLPRLAQRGGVGVGAGLHDEARGLRLRGRGGGGATAATGLPSSSACARCASALLSAAEAAGRAAGATPAPRHWPRVRRAAAALLAATPAARPTRRPALRLVAIRPAARPPSRRRPGRPRAAASPHCPWPAAASAAARCRAPESRSGCPPRSAAAGSRTAAGSR